MTIRSAVELLHADRRMELEKLKMQVHFSVGNAPKKDGPWVVTCNNPLQSPLKRQKIVIQTPASMCNNFLFHSET